MELTENQIKRYSRQIVLKEVGGIGQKKLLNSKITLIGAGGLGSPVAYYLAAAGIGHLKIVDFDKVELSNLHRQILHFSPDIHKNKIESALEKLNSLNPDCNVEIINRRVVPDNVKNIIKGSDFVIEGSDNFATKILVNDACVYLKIPFTIAGALRYHGQLMTVIPEKNTTCYRCVFGDSMGIDSGMSCSQAGVLGMTPGVMGCLEANEAIKFLLGMDDLIINRLLFIDLFKYSFNFINIYRERNCPACGINAKDLTKTLNYGSENVCL